MKFKFTPYLDDGFVKLVPIDSSDFESLYTVASDKKLWAGHPSKNRHEQIVFKECFKNALKSKHALKIIDVKKNRVIGSSRYYDFDPKSKEVAIGYTFISRNYWGGTTNNRIKRLMIEHAFKQVNKVWFHADPINIRSQKAIKKIGAIYSHKENKILSNGIESYYCYGIEKSKWLSTQSNES